MRKILTGAMFAGMLTFSSSLICSAVTSPRVGLPITDMEASSICGGCDGADSVRCYGGSYCGTGTFYTSGHGTNQNSIGNADCGGATSCNSGYLGKQGCDG